MACIRTDICSHCIAGYAVYVKAMLISYCCLLYAKLVHLLMHVCTHIHTGWANSNKTVYLPILD
jgi:hypothetical protein